MRWLIFINLANPVLHDDHPVGGEELFPLLWFVACVLSFVVHFALTLGVIGRQCSVIINLPLRLSHLMTKPIKWHMRPAKPKISLGGCPG